MASPAGIAFVFPGQGSQKVGMGRSWAEAHAAARRSFEEADEALGWPLSRLCWEGPADELQLTPNTQPAILATSVAIYRVVAERGRGAAVMAGHSLGEYTAHVAAGTLSFADALRLVRRRGELMQEAVPVGEGAMAAVLGLDPQQVAEAAAEAAEGQVCAVANFNSPEQTVIAGHREAVARAVGIAERRGARRALLLPVSAPFHCPLMAPAREALTPMLEQVPFNDPRVPVVSNVDAAPVRSGSAARRALIRQVDSPVRWSESVRWMAHETGVSRFVEIGPGTVLSGLIRRTEPGCSCTSLNEPEALAGLES